VSDERKPGDVPRPTIVERLKERAEAEDVKPVPTESEAKEQARANLVQQLAEARDPDEIRTLASALASLSKIEPADAAQERDGMDLSMMSDSALEEIVNAGKLWRERKDWPAERLAAAHKKAEDEREAEREEARRLMERGRRCTCQAPAPAQPAGPPVPDLSRFPTRHAGEGWRR
jgi:hypothetical protein